MCASPENCERHKNSVFIFVITIKSIYIYAKTIFMEKNLLNSIDISKHRLLIISIYHFEGMYICGKILLKWF
jgi:hypothetical protein